MPHYYFDTADGDNDTDASGVELANDQEAVIEAVRYAGSLIHDQPEILHPAHEFVVIVRSGTSGEVGRVRMELICP